MSSKLITKTLYIKNMTCVNCENIIERTLMETAGIVSVTVSYAKGSANVTFNENEITPEKIVEILEDHDYYVKEDNQGNPVEQNSKNSNAYNNGSENSQKAGKQHTVAKGKNYSDILSYVIIFFALYLIANRLGLLNIFNTFPLAKEGMGYGMLFIIGVLTSVHCVAMCGGICLSQCVPKEEGTITSKYAAIRPSLLYNLGRVISYTLIGGIVGAIGSAVTFSGTMKGIVQILAGVFMVIMGLNMLNIFPWLRKFNPRMPKVFAKMVYAQRKSNSPLYIGILNGLMPCGPLQAMQIYALSTGSPLEGALSMFLFSVGTFPLMFAFGALSSFLSKKFTSKMMTASAVLVVFLGIFMFNYGLGLSGFSLPAFPALANTSQAANVATIEGDIQVVTTGLASGSYEPIVVQKGIPVKWTIQAEDGDINGCNNSIIISKYEIQKDLQVGDNIIEFTPTESGTVPFSCWMGMIRSKITVVDDLSQVDNTVVADAATSGGSGGSCCAGGAASSSGSNSGSTNSESSDTSNSNSTDQSSNAGGLDNYNNLLDAQIPTDKVVIAEVKEDGTQTVEITYDTNGFSPAIVIMQSGLETEWKIKATEVDSTNNTLIFPYYYAQLDLQEGDNPINFIPDQDFDFASSDSVFYGYVKVVDDINNIDIEAIKTEVSEYTPTDLNSLQGASGASCH